MAEQKKFEALPAGRSLEDLIEAERVNLLQVHAMAKCLYDVLLYSDDDDATLHADVAKVIAGLIDEAVDSLGQMNRRFKAGEFGPPLSLSPGAADSGSST